MTIPLDIDPWFTSCFWTREVSAAWQNLTTNTVFSWGEKGEHVGAPPTQLRLWVNDYVINWLTDYFLLFFCFQQKHCLSIWKVLSVQGPLGKILGVKQNCGVTNQGNRTGSNNDWCSGEGSWHFSLCCWPFRTVSQTHSISYLDCTTSRCNCVWVTNFTGSVNPCLSDLLPDMLYFCLLDRKLYL